MFLYFHLLLMCQPFPRNQHPNNNTNTYKVLVLKYIHIYYLHRLGSMPKSNRAKLIQLFSNIQPGEV